ncbi:hypothetical protein BC936DRAFT_138252 [Jimgerdemannia flammicorona]|uniref:Uncharacterized protein n=2 Tax=Jimgerdemannia flammicorona TaxID=994334 RepID=A0A433DMT1_9FUNG|nr:hypothetical protein BC936DRAFT_138252 [Jimgerdemannia flammicorona]RUS24970.1 hypothetical protein BC938DRAFT_472816 [Jimgerdemannia flammicorona]
MTRLRLRNSPTHRWLLSLRTTLLSPLYVLTNLRPVATVSTIHCFHCSAALTREPGSALTNLPPPAIRRPKALKRLMRKKIPPDPQIYEAFASMRKENVDPEVVWKWFSGLRAEKKAERARGVKTVFDSRLHRELLMYFTAKKKPEYALEVWDTISSRQSKLTVYEYTKVLHYAGHAGYVPRATELFDAMLKQGVKPTTLSFNALIDVYVHARPRANVAAEPHANVAAALGAYDRMLALGIRPDIYTYGALMDMLAKRKDLRAVRRMYVELVACNIRPTTHVFSSIIECLIRTDNLPAATDVLHAMRHEGVEPNVVTYNLLLGGYARSLDTTGTWGLFSSMSDAKVKPDYVTYLTLVALHADLRDPDGAHAVAARMRSAGIQPDQKVYHALMDAHGRAGDATGAEQVLAEMEARGWRANAVTWTTLMRGYGARGDIEGVMRTCAKMEVGGERLDAQILASITDSLAGHGIMRGAEEVWKAMVAGGVRPDVECYTVLMRGYVWCRDLERARDVMRRMIGEGLMPDQGMYVVLVEACVRAGEHEVARKLVRKIVEEAEEGKKAELEEEAFERREEARIWEWKWKRQEKEASESSGDVDVEVATTTTPGMVEGILTRAYLSSPQSFIPLRRIYIPLFHEYVRKGMAMEARDLLVEMCRFGIKPLPETFVSLMALYRRERNVDAVEAIWEALGGPPCSENNVSSSDPGSVSDKLLVPHDPILSGIIPHPSLQRCGSAGPSTSALSVLIDSLSGASRTSDLHRVWKRLEQTGYVFSVNNWNRLAVAMVVEGHFLDACAVVSRRLLSDPVPDPESAEPEKEMVVVRGTPGRYAPFPHQRTMTALAMVLMRMRRRDAGSYWGRIMKEIETRFPNVVQAVESGELMQFERGVGANVIDELVEKMWEGAKRGEGRHVRASVYTRWRRKDGR